MTSAKLDAVEQCYLAAVANYNLQLHYKTGKSNVEADALCIPWQQARSECLDLDLMTVIAIIMGCITETPLFEADSGMTVILPQKDTLFFGKERIDQNPPITNQE